MLAYINRVVSIIWISTLVIAFIGCSGDNDIDVDVETQEDNDTTIVERYVRLSFLRDYGQFSIPMDSQGMDVYDDSYLFQASYAPSKGCGMVTVDMKSRSLFGEFTFSDDFPVIHMNNVNCGRKYDEHDKFPLLYISEANHEKKCFVIRLSEDAREYSIIQTIRYVGELSDITSYMDWFLDIDGGFIYTYGRFQSSTDKYYCMKFLLPPIEQESVVFRDDDMIEQFSIEAGVRIPQGTKLFNGVLYTVYGYNTEEYPAWLMKYDLTKKQILSLEKLDRIIGEPEAVAIYQQKILINNNATNPSYWLFSYN